MRNDTGEAQGASSQATAAAGNNGCEATKTPDATSEAAPRVIRRTSMWRALAWPAASSFVDLKATAARTPAADGPRRCGAALANLLTTRTTPHLRTLRRRLL